MARKILVVDDEKPIVELISFNLKREGYDITSAGDGEEALEKALNENPDLILLDVMLPKMDGFTVCRKIREKNNTPVIMITAKEDEVDKVLGLELGADDYMTKPFGIRELTARVKANLRRTEVTDIPAGDVKMMNFGDITIDLNRYEAKKSGTDLELTLREFELLKFLSTYPGQVFSREALLEKVWGYEYFGDMRTVDVTVRRLREKLENDAADPSHIMTKRGVGYYFQK